MDRAASSVLAIHVDRMAVALLSGRCGSTPSSVPLKRIWHANWQVVSTTKIPKRKIISFFGVDVVCVFTEYNHALRKRISIQPKHDSRFDCGSSPNEFFSSTSTQQRQA